MIASSLLAQRRSSCLNYILVALLIVVYSINIDCVGDTALNHLKRNKQSDLLRRRLPRSPFVPPMVTALNPNGRLEKETYEEQAIRVQISHHSLMHPIVDSQRTLPKNPPAYKSVPYLTEKRGNSDSYIPLATVDQEHYGEAQRLSFMLQNDQSLVTHEFKLTNDKLSSGKTIQKKSAGSIGNEKRTMQFNDLNHLLKEINKTSTELKKIFDESFHEFLEFVEKGASKLEILDLIAKKTRIDENSELKRTKYRNSASDLKRYKNQRLMDLPYEEIVHEIPAETNFYKKNDINERFSSKDYDPDRIPRDSPIVTHMSKSKPRLKEENTNKMAVIVSVSVDEKPIYKVPSKYNLIARNKMAAEKENQNGRPFPHMYSNSEPSESQELSPKSSYRRLKLFFPIKGILMFCGILGSIALVTVLILIIYGSVKCRKQKPISNNYKVNERIELTTAQCQ